MAEMRASMLLKIAVEGKDQVQSLVREVDALQQAGKDLGRGLDGQVRLSDWNKEKQAVQGVVSSVRELEGAVKGSSGGIGEAVGQWNTEKTAVQGVVTAVRELQGATATSVGRIGEGIGQWNAEKAAVQSVVQEVGLLEKAIAQVARERIASRPGGIGHVGGAGDSGGTSPREDGSHDGYDWGGHKVPPHAGPRQGTRASEWMAQQQAMQEVEEQAVRTTERIRELEDKMAHYGMGAMAFGQLRQVGSDLRKPIQSAEDQFVDFQQKVTDLAVQADRPHDGDSFGDNLLRVARAANVPWEEPLAGEQKVASLGGGDQLKAIRPLEVGLNRLAVASRSDTEDLYGNLAHYIQMGLTPERAMDALKVNYAQGKGGAFELRDMNRFMPALGALGRSTGMTPWQAATDIPGLLQIMRENVGTPGEAATLATHLMQKLSGDKTTMNRFSKNLGLDLLGIRQAAQARGEDPLIAMLHAIAASGKATDPKVMGDLAHDLYFRRGLDAFIQHEKELGKFKFSPEQGQQKIDEDYAAQNSTVAAARRRAEIAKNQAAIQAGGTQAGLMGTVAHAQEGAWNAGSWIAQHFPTFTAAAGAGSNIGGGLLQAAGQIGEAAFGIAAALKGAQWLGTKYPALGGAAETLLKSPLELVKGLGEGIAQGVREGLAEAAKAAAGSAGGGAGAAAAAKGAGGTPSTPGAGELSAAELRTLAQRMKGGGQGLLEGGAEGGTLAKVGSGLKSGLVGAAVDMVGSYLINRALAAIKGESPEQHARWQSYNPFTGRFDKGIPNIPVMPSATEAMNAAQRARAGGLGAPTPTMANQPTVVNNDNKKFITAPVTVNVSVNATLNNSTPAAVGRAVGNAAGAAVAKAMRASTSSLHDGPETK